MLQLILHCLRVFRLLATFSKVLLRFVLQLLELYNFDFYVTFAIVCVKLPSALDLSCTFFASLYVISLRSFCESCPGSSFRYKLTSISFSVLIFCLTSSVAGPGAAVLVVEDV